MIQKLRRKFVLVFMAIVSIFTLTLLVALYLSAVSSFEQTTQDVLRTALDRGDSDDANLPTAVVEVAPSGHIKVLSNHIYYLTEEKIADMVALARQTGTETGTVGEFSLRWRSRRPNPGFVRYAFADTYVERHSLRSQAVTSWVVGAASFLGFFLISVFLSRWMVRPVEDAWRKQRQFVADASHELKTPLTAALSNVDMVIAAPDASREKNTRRLQITKTELFRMKSLVEKLLVLARADAVDAQEIPLITSRVDFSDLVSCCVVSFEPVVYDAGKQLTSAVTASMTVQGDAKKLRELADILLDNACKYSAPRSLIRVVLAPGKKHELLFSVATQGVPISEENRTRIFERFYRIDESRGEIKGYGLGLPIAKSIVEEHHGRIWVESGPSGNTFFVTLPAAREQTAI